MCRKFFLLTSFVVVLSLVGNASSQPTGKILFEYWLDIGGVAVSDLTSAAGYPDNPDDSELLDKFEGPVDWADNYGIRARGFLYPPADGDYTLWISGDDYIELYLSTDDDPANMALVAEVPGWTNALEWGKYPEQQSAPITLVDGQKYYIEALMKEGGGGDSLTAAWAGPEIGEEPVVIDGAYLSAVIRKASRGPIPADGAVDADVLTLEWTAGDTAVSHKVYLSTDATIDESDFLAEGPLTIQFADLALGTAYYWRVDEVEADGTVIEGKAWSFTTLPIEAHFPSPEDGAKNVAIDAKLSWTAGKNAIMHDVYFGTDEAAVAASDPSTFQGKLMDTSFDPGLLEPFMTYYWKVDEFAIIVTNPGPVWSFSTPKYLVIDDDETTLDYDNSAEPYVSEASWDTPQDLTIGGLADLTLRFHGKPASEGSVSLDEASGTYTITGSGADIWGSSDQFHYGYVQITGDATIVARVVDNGTGSNNWAKGGVMIRETLDADSKHMIMALTGSEGGGIAFQGRPVTGERSNSFHGDITAAPPHWVKLTREGNTITAYHSADGVTWELFTCTSPDGAQTNPIDVEMADPVLIGLFVTSHAAGEKRTFTFDNVDVVGNIISDTASTDIGIPGNDVEPLYVALEDSTGAVASVTHPYAAAVQIDSWRDWTIPLSKFTGVDPTDAVKLYVGVGDGEPGGSGSIRVDDIRVVMSATAANIIWVSGTYDDNGDGAPDDEAWVDMLEALGHTVDYNGTYWRTLDDDKIAALNAADLVIISRNSNSGDYDDGDEPTQWNSVTTPILNCAAHLIRSSRWRWLDTTTLPNLSDAVADILAPDHPIFAGVASPVQVMDGAVGPSTFPDVADVGNGTLLAQTTDGLPWIVVWEPGVEFYPGSGEIAGGPRMIFPAGTQESGGVIGRGEYNLTPEGEIIFLNAVNEMLTPSPLQKWAATAVSSSPGFFATNIEDGVYDIGTFSGDMTYEFVVRSNPDETEGSMCLIGRRDFGPPEAGLKYEQWNNTGTYGATLFGVVDLDYGIATNPGVDTHLVFVSSEDASTTALYVNGVYQASVDRAITLFGLVGIGYGTRDAEGANTFDDFDGDIYGVAIYDTALSEGEIKAHSIAYFALPVSLLDVTVPGDIVKGVPDDGDWPGAETPPLAIDDNTGTKYLHFKGETETTGFQVTPLDGPSIVTGLTFTTANDAAPRDPIAFELYGSNVSIDGPYELIASGDIVDFAQADAWPRFTKNETPISFENDVVYDHYQVLFPAVRDAASANSMQIAEVELLGGAPSGYAYDGGALDSTWDHDNGSDKWDGTGPGEGMPGGAVSLTEDGVTFLRIQDTGDPRDYGMSDPTNRKVYLTRLVDIGLDGARLEFCARVATSAPLDDMYPDGGAGIEPWPEGGIGYHIRDHGKGMFGISDGVVIISFSLAQPGELYLEDIATDVLVMNNLVGTDPLVDPEPLVDVDTEDAAAAVAVNMLAVDDVTQWNTFTIDIAAGGAGTHIVSVSVNGGPAESFEVTAGSGTETDSPYITIGSSGTGGITAFDVDYVLVQ